MPARIIPHDPEMFEQNGDLWIPKMKIGAKRVGEHQYLSVLVKLDENIELFAANRDNSHALAPVTPN